LLTPSKSRTSNLEIPLSKRETKEILSSLSLMVKLRLTKRAKHPSDLLTDTCLDNISANLLFSKTPNAVPPSKLSLMLKLLPSSAIASKGF